MVSHAHPAQPAINQPPYRSIYAGLKARAEHAPDALAILAPNRTPLTYGRLYQHVEDTMRTLHAMGLGRRDRLAVVLPNGPEIASALLAVTACATCAPLDPDCRASEFAFYLQHIRAKALLIQADMDSPARAVARARGMGIIELLPQRQDEAGLFTLSRSSDGGGAMHGYAQPDDVALVLPTSGTVSQPKIVPLTHLNVCTATHNLAIALALTASDRCLNILPFFHIHALQTVLLASVFTGASMVCPPQFSTPAFFSWLDVFRPTWYTAVPSVHQDIVAYAHQNPAPARGSSLRLIRSGSAALPNQVREGLESAFGALVIETYGATEAAGFMTCNPPPSGPHKAGSVGKPVGPEMAIMDETGHLLPIGETGEIVARGITLMQGYENHAAANEAAFTDGWYRSGDQGYLDVDGYVYVTGRCKEVINRGGRNVSPREVDDILLAHPAVVAAATFAVPHARWGEDVVSAVVLQPGAVSTEPELRRFVAAHLTRYKVPSQVLMVDRLPVGPSGKWQRHRLAEQLGLTHATARTKAAAPLTPLQEVLVGLWASVLDVESVDLADNFFRLGGDSLAAIRLLSRIHEVTHVDMALHLFFAAPSVAETEAYVTTVQQTSSPLAGVPLRAAPRRAPLPLSYGQQRLWFLEHLGFAQQVYHLLDTVRLYGPLQVAALEQCLQAVATRHETLRTTFMQVDGELRQRIDPFAHLPVAKQDLRHVAPGERDMWTRTLAQAAMQPSFDFEHGPLIRVTLIEFDEDDHVLCIAMHHIISDGWSRGVFWGEVSQLYRGLISGQPAALPTLPIQYADFACWQQQWLQSAPARAQATYWKQQLAGAPMLQLPADYPRPDVQTFRGARHILTLPLALTQAIKTLSQRHGVTLFMTLLAAFQTLLYRYTRQDDIVVGSLIAHRHRAELEPLIGFFVNTFVLRTDLSGDPSFQALLVRVRDVALSAYEHKDVPYEKLLEALRPPRDLSRNPVFQVMCVLHNTTEPVPELSGLTASPVEIDPGTARFDLTLDWRDTAAGLQCRFEYSTDLFEAATIGRLSRHLQTLLDGMVARPEQRISQYTLLTADERQQLLVAWNATSASYPDDQCLHHLFELHVRRTPHATAMICGQQALTYRVLNERANRVAHYLQALGVEPADLVGLCLDRSLDMVIGLLGILKAGAACVPLDPAYPVERLALMLADAEPVIVLTQDRFVPRLPPHSRQMVSLEAHASMIARCRADNPVHRTTADSLAFLLYTSGSTGRPNGVLGGHRAALNVLHWLWQTYPFARHEVCCHHISISFADATQELLSPLLQGTPTVLIPEAIATDLPRFVQTLAQHRVSRLILVPSLLRTLLDLYGDLQAQLPHLQLWFCGGEALSYDLYQRFQGALPGSRLVNLYGATETSANATWYDTRTPPGPGAIVALGRPIANTHIYILDANQQPVPIGVTGELYVGGASLAQGYLKRPELTAARWLPNPFSDTPGTCMYRVGDMARYRADGHIEYLGRLDQQVKLRGMRIELGEIEAALMQHPTIRQTVVIAREDTPGETRLIAYLVTVQDQTIASRELRRLLEKQIPEAWVPAVFITLAALPLTPSGKVDRQALPKPGALRLDLEDPFVAPRHASEKAVAAIWQQLLGLDRVGIHDNFFELGGHSLLAMYLLFRVLELTQVEISLTRFFAAPTVSGMAAHIDAAQQTGTGWQTPSIASVPRNGILPASIAQEQVWHLDRALPALPLLGLPPRLALPHKGALNIAQQVRLRGPLNIRVLEQSCNAIINRHENLRTTFASIDGQLVQVIAPSLAISPVLEDLRVLPKSQREYEAQRRLQQEAQRPFDLEQGPLLRLHLLWLDEQAYRLLIVIHHMICDGLSLGILVHELAILYDAFAFGEPSPLPALPIQYADFAAWQRRWQQHSDLQAQLAYWQHQLRDPCPELAILSDHAGPSPVFAATDMQGFELTHTQLTLLKTVSQEASTTLFTTCLAALNILLYRYTGQAEICIATLVANRARREMERLIGLLMNTVLLKTDLSGNPTYGEALGRVRTTVQAAFANQELPFEELVRMLEQERNLQRRSLCQVLVIWQEATMETQLLPKRALHIEMLEQNRGVPNAGFTTFDMILTLREQSEKLVGSVIYSASRYQSEIIAQLVDGFYVEIQCLASKTDQFISQYTSWKDR